MARRRQPRARVAKAFVRIPAPLEPGKVRCVCGRVVALTKNRHLRRHQTPAGEPCAHQATYAPRPHLTVVPPVKLPQGATARTNPNQSRRQAGEPARLDAGSTCEDCGRWLPGERRLCGRCTNARTSTRKQQARA